MISSLSRWENRQLHWFRRKLYLRHWLGHKRNREALRKRRLNWLFRAKWTWEESDTFPGWPHSVLLRAFILWVEATGHDLHSFKEKKADNWPTSNKKSPSSFLKWQKTKMTASRVCVWGLLSGEKKKHPADSRAETIWANPLMWQKTVCERKEEYVIFLLFHPH